MENYGGPINGSVCKSISPAARIIQQFDNPLLCYSHGSSTIAKIALCLMVAQCLPSISAFEIPLLEGYGKKEAFVVGDSIMVFTTNVSTQAREDVRNATLFAQFAANAVNPAKNPDEWHENYVYALNNIGIIIQSFQSNQKVNADTFTMEELSLSTLKTVSTPTGNALAKTAIEALGKLPASDRSVKIFNNQTTNFTPSGNFQVCVCDQSNGFVVIGFGFLYFHANKYDSRFLWSQWNKADITMFTAKQSAILDEDIYAQVRDTITRRLGDTITTFTSEIKI